MSLAESTKDMEEFREAHWRNCNDDISFEDRPCSRSRSPGNGLKNSSTKMEPRPPPPPPPPRSHRYSKSTGSACRNQKKKTNAYSSSWSFDDPEVKRQRRVATYKSYGVEGKMKASLRDSFRWFKNKCCSLVHGY